MNKVTLVWEEVPESTKVYALLVSDEDLIRLIRCHGKFINHSDFEGDDNNWLVKFGENLSKDLQIFGAGMANSTIVEGTLIVTGWVL